MTARAKFTAQIGAEAVAASTAYVLVDLSDSTNFPHTATNEAHLLGLHVSAEGHSNAVFDIWVGVISEVDASNGTAEWFDIFHLESDHNPTDSTDRFTCSRDYTLGGTNPEGINCCITSGSMTKIVTMQRQAGNTNWQTDTGLASPVGAASGATGKPGAGDIVVWVEEATNGGTLDFSITATYETA